MEHVSIAHYITNRLKMARIVKEFNVAQMLSTTLMVHAGSVKKGLWPQKMDFSVSILLIWEMTSVSVHKLKEMEFAKSAVCTLGLKTMEKDAHQIDVMTDRSFSLMVPAKTAKIILW